MTLGPNTVSRVFFLSARTAFCFNPRRIVTNKQTDLKYGQVNKVTINS